MTEVWFDADYGTNIGLGHLNRCVSLAKVFQSKEAVVKFLARSSEAKAFLKSKKLIRPMNYLQLATQK